MTEVLDMIRWMRTRNAGGGNVGFYGFVDNGVGSSGEATFIAFRKRPNTRSFGEPPCGLSTANRAFVLSDGAVLNLTVSVMADRDKTVYGDQVPPDETAQGQSAVVERAVAWLQAVNP